MITLGLSGLFSSEADDYDPPTMYRHSHDAAACIVRDGVTVAAVEEERLNRDKHTFRFPLRAIRECLDMSGVDVGALDNVAFYFEEQYLDDGFARLLADDPQCTIPPARQAIADLVGQALGSPFDPGRIDFHPHHLCHAASAYFDSTYDNALVLVSDGNAERDGVSVYFGRNEELNLIANYRREHSLGHFYTVVTKMLGYRIFDEYKVMGLAAFGDPEPFLNLFTKHLELLPNGQYRMLYEDVLSGLIEQGFRPRRSEESFTQTHKDLAAAAQRTLEIVTEHVLRYWRMQTNCENLCIAGGVGQNTTLNGRLLRSGEFASIFVPAAAHDAGAALGAAMLSQQQYRRSTADPAVTQRRFSPSPYLGMSIGNGSKLRDSLNEWLPMIEIDEVGSALYGVVADHLANGAIIGWVQGRSEFGPRALGNRSILADPRPAENRERVNRRIKEREDYRPFAPVVVADAAHSYFEMTNTDADHRYMGFVLDVRPEHRTTLRATTHVDGTSRIQTVCKSDNPELHALIKAFAAITGVPVLLNTSFNNNAEPIVESPYDVVSTFLTANLDFLAIGPFLIKSSTRPLHEQIDHLVFELMPFVSARREICANQLIHSIGRTACPNGYITISTEAYRLIAERVPPAAGAPSGSDRDQLCKEMLRLWNKRLIRPLISPGGAITVEKRAVR